MLHDKKMAVYSKWSWPWLLISFW